MAWFKRDKTPIPPTERSSRVPEDMWIRCSYCREIVYRKEMERDFYVCPKCNYHFRLDSLQRLQLLADRGSFSPYGEHVRTADPLGFKDAKKYRDRVRDASRKSGQTEAILTGEALMEGRKVQLCIFDFAFMGGSMGAVVGERLTRAIEKAAGDNTPLVTVSCSGGARMQEGLFSLMQMAKTASALTGLSRAGRPYISILADPTTGGVSASFAMLGDVVIAEPKALIGFAGPRVIEQTIGEKLPEGFQRAEFLLEHGLLDMVVDRNHLKKMVVRLVDFFAG
ncbi:acetyl-CoA carboxylase, carboxyltransferase subunit beta [bacterium]|nr:acetyl-CoA carboxylase, carboxyltransferase subunit beta [bacterium]